MGLVRLKVINEFLRRSHGHVRLPLIVVELTQEEFDHLTNELHVTERYIPDPTRPIPGYEDRDALLMPYKGVYIPVVWK